MLYIIASYRLMQFQENLMCKTWKNGKKTISGEILASFVQIWAPKIFFVDFTSTTC